jgi:Family of unknown function (DUF6009)
MITATDPQLADEQSIVWLTDTAGLPYVRETVYQFARSRHGRVVMPGAIIVGFAELAPTARSWAPGYFRRRVFWLKPGSDEYPGRCVPSESVDPLTIQAGIHGRPVTTTATTPRTRASKLTQRQIRTAAAYLFGDRRARPTQAQVAEVFGIKQPAVSRRLKRFAESLPAQQRERYLQLAGHSRQKRRVIAFQISEKDNI